MRSRLAASGESGLMKSGEAGMTWARLISDMYVCMHICKCMYMYVYYQMKAKLMCATSAGRGGDLGTLEAGDEAQDVGGRRLRHELGVDRRRRGDRGETLAVTSAVCFGDLREVCDGQSRRFGYQSAQVPAAAAIAFGIRQQGPLIGTLPCPRALSCGGG